MTFIWLALCQSLTVLKSFCKTEWSLTFLNVNEIDIRIDASQFKQNEIEVIVAIELVKIYAEVEISIKNIVILTKYTAQVQLLKRSLVSDSKVWNVEVYMIDSFQGEEASVIILCMMKIKKLDFMSQFNRLLTVCNYACNLFVVLCNYDEFQHDYACNLHMIQHVQNLFLINKVYEKYFSQQEFIDFMKTERQFQEQESQWNENKAWYASEDQATNSSEEQEHHQNMSENQAINSAEEQKHYWNASENQATNSAKEQKHHQNVSEDQAINFSEEQEHHQNTSEDQVINFSEEQEHHQNASEDQVINFSEVQKHH